MCTKEDNPILEHIKGDNYYFGTMGFLYDLTHSSSLKLNCLLFRQYEFSKKSLVASDYKLIVEKNLAASLTIIC